MDMALTEAHRALSTRARNFWQQVLEPIELRVDEHGGLPEEDRPGLRQTVRDWGLQAINHTREQGGGGYNIFEQTLINERRRIHARRYGN